PILRFVLVIFYSRLVGVRYVPRNAVPDAVFPKVKIRVLPQRLDSRRRRFGPVHSDKTGLIVVGEDGNEPSPVPEQVQYKNHQDNILVKRLPGRQLDRIAKASAIGNLVRVRRIKRKEGKEHHQDKKDGGSKRHPETQQHGHTEGKLKDDKEHPDSQGIGYEDVKERPEVVSEHFEVFLQLDLGTDRIVEFDQSGKDEQSPNKINRKAVQYPVSHGCSCSSDNLINANTA